MWYKNIAGRFFKVVKSMRVMDRQTELQLPRLY